MTTTKSNVINVSHFASELWVLIEELHCWQISLEKYEQFDQRLWELCLEYPHINQSDLVLVERVLQRQYGYIVRMLTAQYAFKELRKIVSPELYLSVHTECEKEHRSNYAKSQTRNCRVRAGYQWLLAKLNDRNKLTELSTIAVNVIRLSTYLLLAAHYLKYPEELSLGLQLSDDELV